MAADVPTSQGSKTARAMVMEQVLTEYSDFSTERTYNATQIIPT